MAYWSANSKPVLVGVGGLVVGVLVVWAVAFLAITATTYGKLAAKQLGAILLVVVTYTFWLPVVIMALGNNLPQPGCSLPAGPGLS